MPPYTNPTSPTSARPVPPEKFPLDLTRSAGGDAAYANPTGPTAAVPAPPAVFPVAGVWATYDEVRAPTSQHTGSAGLDGLTKAELLERADAEGVEVNKSDTKDELVAKLESAPA